MYLKKTWTVFLAVCCHYAIFAQAKGDKCILDTTALRYWQGVENGQLSDDGSYAGYYTYNTANPYEAGEFVLQAVDGKWSARINSRINAALRFLPGSRQAIVAMLRTP